MNTELDTKMSEAVKKGTIEQVKILIDQGGDVNVKNTDGDSPLTLAVQYGNLEIVNLLLTSGADPNIKDSFGRKPLYWAVKRKKFACVVALISSGAKAKAATTYLKLYKEIIKVANNSKPVIASSDKYESNKVSRKNYISFAQCVAVNFRTPSKVREYLLSIPYIYPKIIYNGRKYLFHSFIH